MSRKLLFNRNSTIPSYGYVRYYGTIISADNTIKASMRNAILKGKTTTNSSTSNLFDINGSVTDFGTTTHEISGDTVTVIGGLFVAFKISLEANKTYTISCKTNVFGGVAIISDYTRSGSDLLYPRITGTEMNFTYTPTSNYPNAGLLLYGGSYNAGVTYSDIFITDGASSTQGSTSVTNPVLKISNTTEITITESNIVKNKYVNGYTGEITDTPQNIGIFTRIVEPSCTYIYSGIANMSYFVTSTNGGRMTYNIVDKSNNIVSYGFTADNKSDTAITIPSNGYKITISVDSTRPNVVRLKKDNEPNDIKKIILSCNEEVILRSNENVYDELSLLNSQVIQRIGNDGSVLTSEIFKNVNFLILDENGNNLDNITSFDGTTYITTSSDTIAPDFDGEIATDN
jgi:hypothetical protein